MQHAPAKDQDGPVKNALVVDDGLVERLLGKAMLEKLGFTVSTAANGQEALQVIGKKPVDLVLCDIAMPVMNGLELLDTARDVPEAPPFIMSTNHDDAEHAVASMRLGARGYLIKPLRFDRLRDAVAEVMARQQDDRTLARQTERQARLDPLTGLLNRTGFRAAMEERGREAHAATQCGALVLLKIQGLDHINHSYGRDAGNKALEFAAATLARLVRPTDVLARFGGDVFAVHLDGVSEQLLGERAAAIMTGASQAKTVIAGEAFSLSLALGGACDMSEIGLEELLGRADFALHLACERSRNHFHIYSDADEVHKRELSHQLNLLATVRAALDDPGRMSMHFQPIVDLASGAVVHYEALLRITDEQGRRCNIGEAVRACEVFGLVDRLDRAVVRTCLEQLAMFPPGAGIAINISGKSIGDPELLHLIERSIAEYGIAPSRLIFELTETAAFYNLDEVRHFVQRIKNLGCRFALDDFGVGFSSFYYIKELDFDYLKLDGSFITHLTSNAQDQVFVRAMVEISKVFGLSVIAEWVENSDTAQLLRQLGVSLGQGYYFGPPEPLDAPPRPSAA